MSEAPERIWAFMPDIFDNMSVWQDAPSPAGDTVEYIRAYLPPTLEAALALPVAQALVEAVKALLDAIDDWPCCPPGADAEFAAKAHIAECAEQARGALRKVEGE